MSHHPEVITALEALRQGSTNITLDKAEIGDEGAKALAAALENHHSLTELGLYSNKIGDEGAKALASALENHHSLTKLDLAYNEIGDEGAKALASALENHHSLKELSIGGNKIGEEGAKALSSALENQHSLTELDFAYNEIGDEGAKALASALENHHSLTILFLAYDEIGDEGAKALASALENHHSLTKLYLAYNEIGDEGAKALASALENHHSLTSLYLGWNIIGEEGTKALASALENHHSLTKLYLGKSNIGDEGAKALAAALENHHSLTELGLYSNKIGDEGAEALASALENHHSLTKLDLAYNEIGDEGAKALASALENHHSLKELSLINNQIGDEGAKALSSALENHQSITKLYLGENNIGTESAKALASALENHHSLTAISLVGNNIGVEGAKALASALKNHHSLTAISLGVSNIGDVGAKALASALRNHHSLTELYLTGNNIGDEGVAALAAALEYHHSLTTLILQNNLIRSIGAKALASALKKSLSLNNLDLAYNSVDDSGAKALARALKHNVSLEFLGLQGNNIGPSGFTALADALEENDTILLGLHPDTIPEATRLRIGDRFRFSEEIMEYAEFSKSARNALSKDQTARWGRAKLMVVGKAGAGKTSTIRTLLGKDFKSEHDSTIGVDLKLIRTKDWQEQETGYRSADLCEVLVKHQLFGERMSLPKPVVPKRSGRSLTRLFAPWKKDKPKPKIVEDEVARSFNLAVKLEFQEKGRAKVDREISFTVWDYGGQEVFYALHHLFLTNYGVCVIVFDMREVVGKENFQNHPDYESMQDEEVALKTIQFWLDSISLHAEGADVVLVGTYLDAMGNLEEDLKLVNSRLEDVLRQANKDLALVHNLGDSLCYYPLDNTERQDERRCKMLRDSLWKTAVSKDYVQEKVPLRWSLCLEHMFLSKKDYMELDAVKELATNTCKISEDRVPEMLDFMHQLGVIVHLTSTEALKKYVILHPQWLLNNLTYVICDPRHMDVHATKLKKRVMQPISPISLFRDIEKWEKRGIATSAFLSQVWKDSHLVVYFTELMIEMLLASYSPWIPDLDEKGDLLVPSLLMPISKAELNTLLEKFDNAALAYVQFDILPRGVFQRFIAGMVSTFDKGMVSIKQDKVYADAASIVFDGIDVLLLVCEAERRIVLRFSEDDATVSTPGGLSNCIELLQSQIMLLDEAFMQQNLKTKLVLSCDGTTNEESCGFLEALTIARRGKCMSVGNTETLMQSSFSAFFANEEEIKGMNRRLTPHCQKTYDVFLSHSWGKDKSIHKLARDVGDVLQKEYGISCWLDEKEVKHGDISTVLSQGINDSTLGVVFVSREYMDKVNSDPINEPEQFCRAEFKYMVKTMSIRRLIPVVVEEEMLEQREWKDLFAYLWEGTPRYCKLTDGCNVGDVKKLSDTIHKALKSVSNKIR